MKKTHTPLQQDAPWRVLNALYTLARADQAATRSRLATDTRLTLADVDHALAHLERRKLVDADRCRLSMIGLAMIHAYRASKDPRILTLAA